MILNNAFTVAAPVDRVWEYFLDVPNLAPCLPGATMVGDDGDGTYQGKVVAALGPVTRNFAGTAGIVAAAAAAHRRGLQAAGSADRGRAEAE
ncbi:MAG: SRPBCC domain-containing protein, partial [Streptosporangiaceae bacterium]